MEYVTRGEILAQNSGAVEGTWAAGHLDAGQAFGVWDCGLQLVPSLAQLHRASGSVCSQALRAKD